MMKPQEIIEKYYPVDGETYRILVQHSESVAQKALALAAKHPELEIDTNFVYEAAMLHDIGILHTKAPEIGCNGTEPYVCHGYLGAAMLFREKMPKHALVCERHTGTGISFEEIQQRNLPLPLRNMKPISIEEQLICFADKFYTKTTLDVELTIEEIEAKLIKRNPQSVEQFRYWCDLFL